jgi:hypothetical protein
MEAANSIFKRLSHRHMEGETGCLYINIETSVYLASINNDSLLAVADADLPSARRIRKCCYCLDRTQATVERSSPYNLSNSHGILNSCHQNCPLAGGKQYSSLVRNETVSRITGPCPVDYRRGSDSKQNIKNI